MDEFGSEKPPEELPRIFREILRPTVPSATSLDFIRASGDENRRARDLMPLLDRNPATKHLLMKMGFLAEKVAGWRAEVPENVDHSQVISDRILNLLGKDLTRNLVVSMAIARETGAGMPRKTKDSTTSVKFEAYVTFGLQAQEYCADRKLMHADMAFNAGLHYDWLAALYGKIKAPADQKASIKDAFTEGFLTARVAYRLAQRIGKVKYDRYVFSGALLIPIGKSLMNVVYPKDLKERSWAQFLSNVEKHPAGRYRVVEDLEARRFNSTSVEWSSLMAAFGETLRPVEMAIRYVRTPYCLNDVDANQWQLAQLWALAGTVAHSPVSKEYFSPATKRFMTDSKLPMDFVLKTAAEARAEKVG